MQRRFRTAKIEQKKEKKNKIREQDGRMEWEEVLVMIMTGRGDHEGR